MGRRWQRTAVNTEAKYLMLRHAFEALGAMRLELKTDSLNERSRRAILRLGAVEGARSAST
jgi:RimJ/RimL family protein N-acetyltransferase